MQQIPHVSRRAWKRRAMSLLLALVMILGLVPGLPSMESEASAHWADPYLSQLVEWGFIRPDQAGYPDRALTRADFMAIVNRAYGYHESGETPFKDVAENDWFYDDVAIAYTAKYINGTSPTTASPTSPLTRETATTILGRNMMLQESPGELLDFTDARQISNGARGTIKSSREHYLVSGYDEGTFRPQRNVSWGEMASMVTALVGTPLQEPGDYSLGGVFGNVTITSPNVTLRDTVVSGDLYISGGVGLGGIVLENVTVLGRIIASGTGQSEGGGASILLRNVTADELLVDNLRGNFVTLQADGVTEIERTIVRTSAYIEDNTPDGMGLKYISLEGDSYPDGEEPDGWEPILLQLAGRIGEVVNRTPKSTVQVGRGTVAKLTVDETATESNVIIDRGAVVRELNLDTATIVTGEGDIEHLVVNAPGCEVEMLPDQIEIRPGITAIIAGEVMDTVAAEESSMDPMILAGYPQARDVVPTGLDAVFSTNTAGTIYWAVSAITDGSVGEDDLIKPPSYGSIAVRSGSIKVAKGNEETTAKITGLTPGGSYYLSAVLVDARDQRSTVKVISFTTPDNTTPAFCAGYPRMSKVSRTDSVVVVMPNKDCKLYYALLPEGATAPTENELKTGSVAGALGYGVRDVSKNVEDAFRVNDVILEEKTTYVLYLWLTDADGINKAKIFSLKFTTDDETPPEFIVDPTPIRIQATSVGLTFRLNENGTVYWVAVPAGTVYPKPEPGTGYETAPLNSDYAKLQVSSGMNIGTDGKSGRVTARENADGTITVSGLKPESYYDFYYVAKDNAGTDRNYSETVKKITIHTLDNNAPKFSQSFSSTSTSDKTKNPKSNTAIYLDVTEDVMYIGEGGNTKSLRELYQDVVRSTGDAKDRAINLLADHLFRSIKLHKVNIQNNMEEIITETHSTTNPFTEDMTVDYTQVTVESRKEGGIRITFPSSGLHLENGGRYYFTITDIADTSGNLIDPSDGIDFWNDEVNSKAAGHNVPVFNVDFAVVNLDVPVLGAEIPYVRGTDGQPTEETVRMDKSLSFYMAPDGTSTVADTISYDVLIWSGNTVTYDLYYRVVRSNGDPVHTGSEADGYEYPADIQEYLLPRSKTPTVVDQNGWICLGNSDLVNPVSGGRSGRSVSKFFNGCDSSTFGKLRKLSEDLQYQFVIALQSLDENYEKDTWKDTVTFYVNVAAGQAYNLESLADSLSTSSWQNMLNQGMIRGAQSIGRWRNDQNEAVDTQILSREFKDTKLPTFIADAPEFTVNSDSVSIGLSLSSAGTIHYAIAEAEGDNGKPTVTTVRKIMDNDYGADEDGNRTLLPGVEPLGTDPTSMYVTLSSPRPPQPGGTSVRYPMLDWMKGGSIEESAVDVPEEDNLIVEPTRLRVVQKNWRNQVVDSGAFTPVEGVNDTVVSDKVKPGTTYFAYFVITSVDNYDNMSHVYIYQFTTPESMKPSVLLDQVGGTGNVNMSIDVATTGYYRVISESDALNGNVPFLTKPFSEFTAHTGTDTDKTPAIYLTKTENGEEVPYTVFDALTKPYQYEAASRGDANPTSDEFYYPDRDGDYWAFQRGYTVFDMYANDDARSQLYSFIRNMTLPDDEVNVTYRGPSGPTGSPQTTAPRPGQDYADTLLDIGEQLEDDRYVILTYSINPKMVDSSSNPNSSQNTSMIATFTGLAFQKGQMGAPQVKAADGQITKDDAGNYSGYIIIDFDRYTYLKGQTSPVTMTTANLYTGGVDTVTHPNTIVPGDVTRTSFELNFRSAKKTDYVNFPRGYFADGTNTAADLALRITIITENGQDYVQVQWGTTVIAKIPVTDMSGRTVHLTGDYGGDQNNPAITLDSTTSQTASITAEFSDTFDLDKSSIEYTWRLASGTGVVTVTPGTKADGKVTITALKPGKARVDIDAAGYQTEEYGGNRQTASKSVDVTVTGKVTNIDRNNISTASVDLTGDVLTLTVGGSVAPYAVLDVKAIGANANAPEDVTTATVTAVVATGGTQYVNCSVNADNRIIISPTSRVTATNNLNQVVTIEVGLAAQDSPSTDLTPNGKKTLTVRFAAAPTEAPASNNGPGAVTITTKPTLSLSPTVATVAVGKTAAITATATPSGTTVKWTSGNTNIATVTGGRITGKAVGVTTVTASVTAGGTTVTRTVTVHVTGSVTGLTKKSSASSTWDETNKTLTLTKAPNASPSMAFTVNASGTITSTAAVKCSVTDSSGKDASKYVSCTVDANNTITVKPGTTTLAANQKVTVTVELIAKTGSVNLTSSGGKYSFTVQIKGNDSGLNIGSR